MDFRVLGPLEVFGGSGPIQLGGHKQRAVLAHLLVHANQVVSSDSLIEAVWGEQLPDLPRASVHTYVSNLRRSLGSGRIESRPYGYLLKVDPNEADFMRFETLVAEARRCAATTPREAATTLDAALKLWRGDALADLSGGPDLTAEAARLDELRLAAVEERIEAMLALGRHSQVISELEGLTLRHRTRERFWEQLMVALYRSGRPGDALNTFFRAREVIAEELGVDPSPDLQRLYKRMLKQDPDLDLADLQLRGYLLAPGPLPANRPKTRKRSLLRQPELGLRTAAAAFVIVALMVAGLSAVAINDYSVALRDSRAASARDLAAAAVANLNVDPERSILLALRAVQATRSVDGSVSPEAEEALHRAVLASRVVRTIPGAGILGDWSSDGSLLAFAANGQGDVVLRSSATGKTIRSWQANSTAVGQLKFSPDGAMLGTAGSDGTIKLWDPMTGRLIRTLDIAGQGAFGLSFSRIGSLVSGLWWNDQTARTSAGIWDAVTGRQVREISGLAAPNGSQPTAAALSPDGSKIAIGIQSSPRVEVFSVGNGALLKTLVPDQTFAINDLAWSPDGGSLVAVGQDLAVHIWEVERENVQNSLFGNTSAIFGADWSPDGSQLASGGNDGTVRVWSIDRGVGRPLLTLTGHGGPVTGVAFSPDGKRILSTGLDGTAKIWDVGLSGDAEWLNLPGEPVWFSDVTFTPDGNSLLGGEKGGVVSAWDLGSGEELFRIPAHGPVTGLGIPGVASITVSPDGSLIATGGRDKVVNVWRTSTHDLIQSFKRHTGWIEDLRFSPDSKLLASASMDGTARIFDAVSGEEILSLVHGGPVHAIRFAPDGRTVITGSDDGTVRQWDVNSGAILRRIEVGARVQGVAVDGAGTRVATATSDANAGVWDLRSGIQTAILVGHSSPVWAVAFSSDGTRVVTGSEDGQIRFWDARSGVTIAALNGHSGPVRHVAFSPDGKRLASIGAGVIRVWAMDVDDLIQIAERELTRSLTATECRQYLHSVACPR